MTPDELALRMRNHAIDLLSDSEILSQMLYASGKGSQLLSTIALETLLKAVRLLDVGGDISKFGHSYIAIWEALSPATQSDILQLAAPRNAGHADLTLIPQALYAWEHAFVQGRYPYEIHRDKTEAEIAARGAAWIAAGAPVTEAETDFMYYPMEQDSLISGLRHWLANRLNAPDPF